jgi:hypothetical protein
LVIITGRRFSIHLFSIINQQKRPGVHRNPKISEEVFLSVGGQYLLNIGQDGWQQSLLQNSPRASVSACEITREVISVYLDGKLTISLHLQDENGYFTECSLKAKCPMKEKKISPQSNLYLPTVQKS